MIERELGDRERKSERERDRDRERWYHTSRLPLEQYSVTR